MSAGRGAGRAIVLSGPSAVGKSSVVRCLRDRVPDLHFSVSVTTRAPRPGEIDGVDYSFVSAERFQQLIDDMLETMYDEPGIGLAAPQVGRSQQLVVMDCPGEGGFPKTILINPTIQFYGPEQAEGWEGCLSVDGLRGKVTRDRAPYDRFETVVVPALLH